MSRSRSTSPRSSAHRVPRRPASARQAACWAAGAAIALVTGCGGKAPEAADLTLENVGFMTPESVLHDPDADVYLVSNIQGDPFEKDDNGFISRVSPDGVVLELRWIDGAKENVDLDAPKGMAILGDELWVADIDQLRRFDRKTGEPKPSVAIPGATFLNDVCVAPDGAIHVSDSGFADGFAPSSTDAIWRVEIVEGAAQVVTIARGEEFAHPNGICAGAKDLFCVDWARGEFVMVTPSGKRETPLALPKKQLDGLVRTPAGRWFASSWEGECIYEISQRGSATAVFTGLEQPADIGYDQRRGRLLIPLFGSDKLLFRKV